MIKPPLFTTCLLFGFLAASPVYAGQVASPNVPNSIQGIAEREMARRNDSVVRAKQAIEEGDKAMKVKDYEVAVQQYKAAVDALTESPATHDLRCAALDRFCEASVKLAEQRIAEGRYAEAEKVLKEALGSNYNPKCSRALTILAHLEEPGYYNKTITPKFHADVETVKALFVEAQGYYDTGRFEKAYQKYDQILGIDPTNQAAREGQMKVDLARTEYADKAYDQTRGHLLWKLDNAWQIQPRKYGPGQKSRVVSTSTGSNSTAYITNKLNSIIIPKVEFKDATVREAIDFLKTKARELDKETDPAKRGVNIVLQLESPAGSLPSAIPAGLPTEGSAPAIPGTEAAATPAVPATTPTTSAASAIDPSAARITLSLNNVPLAEVLRYISTLAGLKLKIDPYAVAVVPITVIIDTLITKEYKVPPGAFSGASGGGAAASPATATAGSGPGTGLSTGGGASNRVAAKDYFVALGVQFPPGSIATFFPMGSKLIVKNTQEQLDLIDAIVEAMNGNVPMQVDIEAKFVEITQTNLKELGFDWTLGQFNIPGSSKVFAGGGTTGNGTANSATDYTFVDPTTGQAVGGSPLTSGLRNGSSAITSSAIDSLLHPTGGGATPAVLAAAGVFTNPTFQVVMRALNQKKGVDLLSSPRVTTKSGQRATIEIVREFKYPTEYSPPQVPSGTGGGNTAGGGGGTSVIAVTPTTPTAFEVRNTGVSLEVEPVVGADGSTIDLNLVPQVTEFDGFINYGTPIYASTGDLLTQNVINQPIFSTRKVTTSVSVWDGQTVMLGGLMREDVQKVEDKVPFLGDVPLLGRLFRSSVDQHTKRNLVIFVTARLINPAGDAINPPDDEKDDTVDPLAPGALPETAPMLAPLPPMK